MKIQQRNMVRIPLLQPLYKQILSDRTSLSFLPEKFNSDNEVLHAIKDFYLNGEGGNGVKNSLDNLKKLFNEIQDYAQNRINVSTNIAASGINPKYINIIATTCLTVSGRV